MQPRCRLGNPSICMAVCESLRKRPSWGTEEMADSVGHRLEDLGTVQDSWSTGQKEINRPKWE